MNLLKAIGPDALINTFVVNIKGNKDIEVCNKLQDLIFSELTGKVGEPSKRVPMFLTTSSFEKEKYGASYEQLRERLELHETDKNLHFLRNTVMNPFQTSEEVVTHLGKLFRNTVLNCVAEVSKNEMGGYSKLMLHCIILSSKIVARNDSSRNCYE